MNQHPAFRSRRGLAFLFTAAAFLPASLLAQPAQPQEAQPPAGETRPPAAEEPAPAPAEPAQAPPAEEPRARPAEPPAAAEQPAPAAQPPAAPAMPPASPPAPRVEAEPSPAGALAEALTREPAPEAAPTDEAIPPADAPVAGAPAPAEAEPARKQDRESDGAGWLWLLAGAALLIGALAFFMRRRPAPQRHGEPHHAGTAPPDPAPATHAALGTAAGAAAAAQGRPWIELLMRPVRAGVQGRDAIVEFELAVDNQGAAPARDVRISTWMFPSGAAEQNEMERLLVEQPPAATLPDVALDPGESRRIQSALALPTGELEEDSVLPVVVADARYILPDGSEGRTSVSFAVGVPDGAGLAHFSIADPTGLHEGVEARMLADPERE